MVGLRLCLLWVCLNAVAGEGLPCPMGGQIHLATLRCYWLSEVSLPWAEARRLCQETEGGVLADAHSPGVQSFIQKAMRANLWVWIQGAGDQGTTTVGGDGLGSPGWPGGGAQGGGEGGGWSSEEVCTQMAMGTPGERRTGSCSGELPSLCEKVVSVSLPTADSYLAGVPVLSGVYPRAELHTLPSSPDAPQLFLEVQLFPGLWFSHAGQLVAVEMVVLPGLHPTLARVQVLRPYCRPSQHLVPPGCSALLNPFSCCAELPLCNTTGGCAQREHWCPLLEACLHVTSPCTPYAHTHTAGGRAYALPPRHIAVPPFYHLVGELPFQMEPTSELKTVSLSMPEKQIMVYPDDVVAVQHSRHPGKFLRCLGDSVLPDSVWRQSYRSLRGAAWGRGGGRLLAPVSTAMEEEGEGEGGGQWVDGVVCDLRLLYTDTPAHRGGDDRPGGQAETTNGTPPPVSGLQVVYPEPDDSGRVLVPVGVRTQLVVMATAVGLGTSSSWSAPVRRSGVPFLPICPPGLPRPLPPVCEGMGPRPDAWFSSVSLVLPRAGTHALNVTTVTSGGSRSASVASTVSIELYGYAAVTGLTVEPSGHLRMLVGAAQSFTASVNSGSSVKYTWVIANLEEFAYEGESYSVTFKKPAEYRIKVTASNPVSSQTQDVLVTAAVVSPLADAEFLPVSDVIAVYVGQLYSLQVKVDISVGVTFRWGFGDGGGQVAHTKAAPCQTTEGLLERGETQVYVQDSANHTYPAPGDYIVHVQIFNQYDDIEVSMTTKVRSVLNRLRVSSSLPVCLVGQPLLLEASAEPSPYGTSYTWTFGDGSPPVTGHNSEVGHAFGSVGAFNITVLADNGLSALTSWTAVEVVVDVRGLTLSYNGPNELNTVTDIRATVATGTSLIWKFVLGDGSPQRILTEGGISHVYKSPGNYTVEVTASNGISQAHQSINIEVYRLSVSGILPTKCIVSDTSIQLSTQVNGNIHTLAFHWQFGDGSPLTVTKGKSTVLHTFERPGLFTVSVTVVSLVTSVAYQVNVCVEAPITSVVVQQPQAAVAVGQQVCFTVLVSPVLSSGYQFTWFSTASSPFPSITDGKKCFVYADEGVEEVSVVAHNRVSNKTGKTVVVIQRPVSKLTIAHSSHCDTLTVNTTTSFWLGSCNGTNVSVLWDFGDGSPLETNQNVSHLYTFPGRFTVTVTGFNAVNRETVTLEVNVLLPVSDLSLQTNQPYVAVNEGFVITAVSSANSSTKYYWSVDGLNTTQQGTYVFNYVFSKPGVFRISVLAQNLVSKREAAILIKVFERIEGLHIQCHGLVNMKYMPTRETVEFVATLYQGSNVSYHWVGSQQATNIQVTGDGDVFQLLVDTPGIVSVQLTASNNLGEVASEVSAIAVEPVMDVRITTASDFVVARKAVNISVTMVTGSNLQFLWYANSDLKPLQTKVPFLLHSFTSLGLQQVKVSAHNVLSSCNATKQFIVQEEVRGIDFQIDGNTIPYFVNTSAAVSIRGLVEKGSDIHWDWKVDTTAKSYTFIHTNQSFVHTFKHVGVYKVSLNVSNGISWQTVVHTATVQDPIKVLTLKMSSTVFCTGDPVTFNPVVSEGSNVSFALALDKEDLSQDAVVKGQFITSGLNAGRHAVTVKAWNQVSSSEETSSILVLERIQGLRLVGCCSTVLEALKTVHFKADVQLGGPVNYTWTFLLEGESEPSWAVGQTVNFSLPGNGSVSVRVVASNGICLQAANETAIVRWPVTEVRLVCRPATIFVGYPVKVSARVTGGGDVVFRWNFGDSDEVAVTDVDSVNHTYRTAGTYDVMVTAFNGVGSAVSAKLHVEVRELRCAGLQASLVQGSPSTIHRSRPSYFEAVVDVEDCPTYEIAYLWQLFQRPGCADGGEVGIHTTVDLRDHLVDVSSPLLSLPGNALETGRYCLTFTASLRGAPLFVRRTAEVVAVSSPLVAVIKGGSHRVWPALGDVVLDGSDSRDPDVDPDVDHQLQYHWEIVAENSMESPRQLTGRNRSVISVLGAELQSGRVYRFTLTVHKPGRTGVSAVQQVSVCDAPVFLVMVECVSCSAGSSPRLAAYKSPIILSGRCGPCDEQAQYQWSAEDQNGLTLDIDEVSTAMGGRSPDLVVQPWHIRWGHGYTFTLNVSLPDGRRWGSASLTVYTQPPPTGGRCGLIPETNVRLLETRVTYTCSGWQDDDGEASQLIYTFQVAPCQSSATACPIYTLYRGTRSTFGTLVPVGSPGTKADMSVVTVTLLVENHLGAKVVALNRSLTVVHSASAAGNSRWLRNKSLTEFEGLVQHGNPQDIVPYSLALCSQLNQMASQGSVTDLDDRRAIRGNVTRALASLPVRSLHDVDQLSSALVLATAVADELVCEDCPQKVLEAVGNMVHVMEEQMSVGATLSVHTGRSVLNVIGSTLASMSSNVTRPHPPSSDAVRLASKTTLSALGHARTLVRLMMTSQRRVNGPFSLSTAYISAAGFRGNPSKLLCVQNSGAHQPSHRRQASSHSSDAPCRFHIPESLAARLGRRGSEVVQVLLGVETTAASGGSNPLLSAAHPAISTALVAMEITTPQGQPIPIRDLSPEQAIGVTLPVSYPQGLEGGGFRGTPDLRPVKAGGGRWAVDAPLEAPLAVLPAEGRLDFAVTVADWLDDNAGLYITVRFTLVPGAAPLDAGIVWIAVKSHNSIVKDVALSLTAQADSVEETIFLTPLLNGTQRSLSVVLNTSLANGGPVQVFAFVFSSLCQYYDVEQGRWSSEGLRPLEGSTLHEAHCLTRHLTVFGASLFLHPGAVLLLPPSDGPVRNALAGIVCVVLVLTHLLLGLVAHKLDHLDSLRLSQVPLCGLPGLHHYRVLVKTGWRRGAGTTAHVGIALHGTTKSGSRHLQREGAFQRGGLDQFHLETDQALGEVWKIRLWHDNTGLTPSWYVQYVAVWDPQADHTFFFTVEDWLSVESEKSGAVEKEVLASCPEELARLHRVLSSQLLFGVMERHLWLSLWSRPAHSRFTRGQRVTCVAMTLHLYLAAGAVWHGAVGTQGRSGPVSALLPFNTETVAMGMTIAALVFPLQCLLCCLFRKTHSRVVEDVSVPPSPICQSVEMDVCLDQSHLSGPSFLSLPDSSKRDSHSSECGSKEFDSGLLEFWWVSGLAPQGGGAHRAESIMRWPSCDSLPSTNPTLETTPDRLPHEALLGAGRRLLRRKKALPQICLSTSPRSSPPAFPAPIGRDLPAVELYRYKPRPHMMTAALTQSEENLLMSIALEDQVETSTSSSNSYSGRYSPRTASHSNRSCSSCSQQSWDNTDWGTEGPSPMCGTGLYKCPSALSIDSVASTVLPSPSPGSTRASSTTRIGVARGQPGWLLPPGALGVLYSLLAGLLGACLAAVGIYGSHLPRAGVLTWLASALVALLTSALLLEPLKVCVQALLNTALWRPVTPEVDDLLSLETSVRRPPCGQGGQGLPPCGQGGQVLPPCGYGLLQARQEARKLRSLRSLMKQQCVSQLLFLLLVLMLNYHGNVEEGQARLLHSTVTRCLGPSMELHGWSDAWRWLDRVLVSHLHQNPALRLVGLPRLRRTGATGAAAVLLGNSSEATRRLLADLRVEGLTATRSEAVSVEFTHYHRESGLFVCVCACLEWPQIQSLSLSLSIHPLLIPPCSAGPDLQVALTVLLLIFALLKLCAELWALATERAQYVLQGCRWLQLILALLSLATASVQLCALARATSCLRQLRSQPESFVDFYSAALLARMSSQLAAVLLTLLILKLLGTLRFVRRWVVIVRVLKETKTELWAAATLLLLLLLLCMHTGLLLFSGSEEGFRSVGRAGASVLSLLRGRAVLRRLCGSHPTAGPLYGLLLMGGGVWLLARLSGASLIRAHRAVQENIYRPAMEPQDYEMVEFFIRRLKLWMGLSKAKQFRHRVKFEQVGVPPSRSSRGSRLSTLSSSLSPSLSSRTSCSLPCPSPPPPSSPPSSSLSFASASPEARLPGPLDLLPARVDALLSLLDRLLQATEDLRGLEVQLEEARGRKRGRSRRRRRRGRDEGGGTAVMASGEAAAVGEARLVKTGVPRSSLTSSFSFATPDLRAPHLTPPPLLLLLPLVPGFPRRRAWHSGSSRSSADAQPSPTFPWLPGGGAIRCPGDAWTTLRPRSEEGPWAAVAGGAPVKRRAWISEDPEAEPR